MTEITAPTPHESSLPRLVIALVGVNGALPFVLAPLISIGASPNAQLAVFLLCTGAIFALNEGLARSYPAQRIGIRVLSGLNLLSGLAFGALGLIKVLPVLPVLLQQLLG